MGIEDLWKWIISGIGGLAAFLGYNKINSIDKRLNSHSWRIDANKDHSAKNAAEIDKNTQRDVDFREYLDLKFESVLNEIKEIRRKVN